MSLDLAALKALAGLATRSPSEGRLVLERTGAAAEDVTDALRPLWCLVEARVRAQQPLDVVGIQHALDAAKAPIALRAVANEVLLDPDDGSMAGERLELLRETGLRARLVEQLRAVAIASKDGKPLGELEAALKAATATLGATAHRVRNCAGDALAILDSLEASWRGDGQRRLAFGLGDLDEALGPAINNLIAIGAQAGIGKSALVAGLVRNWVCAGERIGLLAYEDDARDCQKRVVAAHAGVSVKHVRGDLFANEHQRLAIGDALEWWSKREGLLECDDARPSGSAADVIRSMREMRRRGCRAVILDNLTCVRMDFATDRADLVVEAALRDIRDEAQALQMPAIVVGHLKRGMSDADETQKPPRLSDFSNAAAWGNYARVALGMWREGKGICLRVLKQTNGPAGQDFDVELRTEAAVVVGTRLRAAAPPSVGSRTYTRRRFEENHEAE